MADDDDYTLTPVDYDPFVNPTPEGTTQQLGNVVKGIGQGIANAITLPGDVATGQANVQPTVPGQWSDEDEARLQATNATIGNRATDLAGMVMSGSMPMAEEGALGMAGGKPVTLRGPAESTSGYVYHATNEERLADISNDGLKLHKPSDFTDQDTWPDGSTAKRNYFTPTAQNTWQFAPEEGNPVLLRIPQDAHPFKRESTGDLYSTKVVPASKIEVLTEQGWQPVGASDQMPTSTPGGGPSTGGIKAYHGSPYDFDKFDISKIGTGEGAQAYGHGLYFAENPSTAQSYRDALAGETYKIDGVPFDQFTTNLNAKPGNYAVNALSRMKDDFPNDPIGQKWAAIDWLKEGGTSYELAAAKMLKEAKSIEPYQGKMYEVSLNADPEHFLDWDKPLSEQNPKVQAFADKLDASGQFGRPLSSFNATGRDVAERAMAGPNLVRTGSQQMESMRDAGIPGIKYLDQGSRNAGDGTRNYVVFSPDIINILKKYGLAGLVAGGAAHFSTQPVDKNPFVQ